MTGIRQDFLPQEGNLSFEDDLLGDESSDIVNTGAAGPNSSDHALVTAPVLTGDVHRLLGEDVFPQVGLYGRVLSIHGNGLEHKSNDGRLFVNTNTPFSAMICGVQGSGKSHSTSVLLESCLIKNERLGSLPRPLASLVFYFDTAAGGGAVQPSEAAYLSSLNPVRGSTMQPPPVTVLVLPNNLRAMKAVYSGLPAVRVEPLHFAPQDISGERLLAMMKVDEHSQMPLYMEAIMNILRSMEGNFDYSLFRQRLKRQKFNRGQNSMLNIRLSLLDSCLEGGTPQNSVTSHFKGGQLTIIDLSSPFMDGLSACGFFDIILGLFVEASIDTSGKLVVLDEAHKYLSDTGASSRLTESLLTVIRQQRHLATRVIISTQEPTIVPETFLDLCSLIIAHRFSSPKWLKHLSNHISTADDSFDDLFRKIVSLSTGQAILFSPTGLVITREHDESSMESIAPIGQGYLLVRSRLRVTCDGGHSLLAVQDPSQFTRVSRLRGQDPSISTASGNRVVTLAARATPQALAGPSTPASVNAIPSTFALAHAIPPSSVPSAILSSPKGAVQLNSNASSLVPGGGTHPKVTTKDSSERKLITNALRKRRKKDKRKRREKDECKRRKEDECKRRKKDERKQRKKDECKRRKKDRRKQRKKDEGGRTKSTSGQKLPKRSLQV